MAYQLKERPHKFCFSENPIRYLVEVTNPDTVGCAVDFELYALPIAYPIVLPGTLITKQTLYPNPDGKVYFYVEDFLNSYLEWELPALDNNDIVIATKQICKYYVRYRQITKNNPLPEYATDADNVRIAIKGGVAKEKFDRNNFFINYLPVKKPWLTWQPAKHFIGIEERRYLSYLHHSGNSLNALDRENVYQDSGDAWAPSSNSGNIVVDSHNNPYQGAEVIEATDSVAGDEVTLLGPGTTLSDFDTLSFRIRSKGDWGADKLLLKFYNEVTLVATLELNDGDYGFDSISEDDYQLINIPIAIAFFADRLKITRSGAGAIGFYIDDISLQVTEGVLPTLKLKARAVWTDGTQETVSKDIAELTQSLLFHCPAGLDQLGLKGLHPDKMLWYYDVSIEDENNIVYAKPYRLYADYRNFYDIFSFTYHNSLSGIDTLRVRGDYDIQVALKSTEIQQATGGDFSNTELPTENADINISKYEIYKGDAGWMDTPEQQDACQELLLSNSRYREIKGRWLRIVNLQKTQDLRAKDDTKWSFPLQWRYTFDNTKYTPTAMDFGAGVNDEPAGAVFGVCTAPGNLVAELIGDDDGGKKYTFSWDDVADALSYELQYKKDGDPDWTTVDCDTFTKDITFHDAGNYSWRVRSKCDENDFSSYAFAEGFTVDIVPPACSAPGSLSVTLLSIETGVRADIKFSWPAVGGVVGYILDVRPTGTTVWGSLALGLVTEVILPFINPNEQYECRIRSICNVTPEYSGYVYGPAFIPSNLVGSCHSPTNLYVTMGGAFLSHRHVRFKWTNAPNAVSYQLLYRYNDVVNWTVVDNCQSGEDRNIHVSRNIVWKVRSNCSDGGVSAYANGPDFLT